MIDAIHLWGELGIVEKPQQVVQIVASGIAWEQWN